MMGFDSRAAKAAWSIFLVGLLLAVIYFIRKVLLVFVIAVLFAYLISPVVSFVHRFVTRGRSRAYSLALVYIFLVGLLILLGFLIGNKVTEEASKLAEGFPKLVEGVKQNLASPSGPAWLQPIKHYFLNQINARGQTFGAALLPILQKVSTHVMSVLSGVVFVVLVPILSFFFLKDGPELRQSVLMLASGERRPMWEEIFADLHTLLGQFIRALIILSIATFVAYSIFFEIVGLPYPVLLASVAALFEFIPVIGPLSAVVLILIAAAFSGTGHILVLLIFFAAYRLFQDYILNPHLMSSGIELHPLLIIFGALAGEELAGIPGMFLSVPVLATLRVIYVRIRKARVAPPAATLHAP